MASEFFLIDEMRQVPDLLRRFDPGCAAPFLSALQGKRKVLLTGEGSSRIFPAKNMIARALQTGSPWQLHTEGARQAAEYDLLDWTAIGASNSGRTRELIELFEQLRTQNIPCLGLTATPGSRLTELSDQSIVLSCGAENAVAATKSVIEQALVYQALLQGNEWQHLNQAADHCQEILALSIPDDLTTALAAAPCIYFAGRNNGVAEELALKTNEIARKRSQYLEGTYVVHGIEEVMSAGEVVVLIEPFKHEMEKIRDVIERQVGVTVIAIASEETVFPTIKIPKLDGFDPYFQLIAGWQLLLAIGLRNGVNLDKAERARKVGNSV